MTRILLVGGGGFVGGYIVGYLDELGGYDISITHQGELPRELAQAHRYDLDLLVPDQIDAVLDDAKPDLIIHLAALSSVALSWKKPDLTVDVNVKGTLNLLEAVRASGANPRMLLIGSGEEYGFVREEDNPIGEETTLHPGNIYAATKACQNMLASIYAKAYGMDLVMVRPFNHIGPEQAPMYVVADFCKQVADIERGVQPAVMQVGNLSARRDFTDVRDVVRAYMLLLEKGVAGQTYNVGSGQAVSIQHILDTILSLSSADIRVEVDPDKLRPVDVPLIEADISKLVEATGWQRRYTLEDTIRETLDYWRARG